jgi:predicted naringenin-chalcone synthase
MSVIRAIGTGSPAHSVSQVQASELAQSISHAQGKDARFIDAIHRRSGIDRRGSVVANATTPDTQAAVQSFYRARADGSPTTGERMEVYRTEAASLAIHAATEAIKRSGMPADAYTHLVTASCTGFDSPGVDTMLVDALGLPRGIERTHVGFMGCHGAINALRVADALVERERERASAALIVCVELCTLHMRDELRPDRIVANALFADGAAAIVLSPDRRAGGQWRLLSSASCLLEGTREAMEWRIGDRGFEMTLAESVPDIVRSRLGEWAREWLARSGVGADELAGIGWAIHPGGPRVLDAARDALGIPEACMSHSRAILREHGNMSSPTVVFILDRISGMTEAKRAVMLAFGPGLTIEAALLERVDRGCNG